MEKLNKYQEFSVNETGVRLKDSQFGQIVLSGENLEKIYKHYLEVKHE